MYPKTALLGTAIYKWYSLPYQIGSQLPLKMFLKRRSSKFGFSTKMMKNNLPISLKIDWILGILLFMSAADLSCHGTPWLGSPYRNRMVIRSVGLDLVQVVGKDSILGCASIQPVKDSLMGGRLGIGVKLHLEYVSDSSKGTYGRIGYFAPGEDGLLDTIVAFQVGIQNHGETVDWLGHHDWAAPDFDCIDYAARPTTLVRGASHPYRECCPFPLISGKNDLVALLNRGGNLPLTSNTQNHEDLIELFIWPREGLLPQKCKAPSLIFELRLASGAAFRPQSEE